MKDVFKKILTTLFVTMMLVTTITINQWDENKVLAEVGHDFQYEMYSDPTCVSKGISHRYCANHSKLDSNGMHIPDPSKEGYDEYSDEIKEYETPALGKHIYNYKVKEGDGYRFYCQYAQGNPQAVKVDARCASTELFSQESGTHEGIFFTNTISSFHHRVTEVVKSPTCSSVGYTQTYCVMHSRFNPTTGLYEYAESQDISNVGDPTNYDKVTTTQINALGSHSYSISYVNGNAVYTCDFADKDPNCKTKVLNGKAGQYTVQSIVDSTDNGSHTNWTKINNETEFLNNITGSKSGNFLLNANVTISSYKKTVIVNNGVTINLCLNGKTLDTNSTFLVLPGGTLRIYDHKGTGILKAYGSTSYAKYDSDTKHASGIPGFFQNVGGTLLISGVNIEHTDDDPLIAVANGTTTLQNGTKITTGDVAILANYNPNSSDYITGTPVVNLSDTSITATGYENAIEMTVGSGNNKKFGVTVNIKSGCVIQGSYYYGVIRLKDMGTVNGSGTPGDNILNVSGNAKIINTNASSGVGIYVAEYGGKVNIKDNAYIDATTGVLVSPSTYKQSKSIIDISGSPTIKSSKYGVSFEKYNSYYEYNDSSNNNVLKLSGSPKITGGSADIHLEDGNKFRPYIEVTGALTKQDGGFKVNADKHDYSYANVDHPDWGYDSLVVKANTTNYLDRFTLVGLSNKKLDRKSNNEIHLEVCNHNYRDMEYQEATDTVDGYRKKICIDCNAIVTEVLRAPGRHVYGSYVQDGPNEHYRVCQNSDGYILVESHRFVTYTDQQDGTHKSTCAECGYQKDAEEHTWGTTITKDSDGVRHYVTCTANGCGARNYSDCEFTHHYTDLGNKVSHDSYCVCGNKITEEHTLVIVLDESREPSATEDGIETSECVCGAKKVRIPGLTSFGKAEVILPNEGDTKYPESAHSYSSYTNDTQTFSFPGTEQLKIKFNGSSETETNYDKITIKYTKDGNTVTLFNQKSGSFKNQEYTIPADNFSIQLTSDGSVQKWGYAFEWIKATVDNQYEEANEDLLMITKPFVHTNDEDRAKGIYSIKTVNHLPTLNIRTAWVADLDVETVPSFEEETYQAFMDVVGTNKVTYKAFKTNDEAAAYKLDLDVPGYYAVRLKYENGSEINYNYQIIRVDVDTSSYAKPQVNPDELDGSVTFHEDNIQKIYIGKTTDTTVLVFENDEVVGTTIKTYDEFNTATGGKYTLKTGEAAIGHKFGFAEAGYYLVRIKFINKFGNVDYIYAAFEVTEAQVGHKTPVIDEDVEDGVIEVDPEDSTVHLEKIYVGYLGTEEKSEWSGLDFTKWAVFSAQCNNYINVNKEQLSGYKYHATKAGWYVTRIKFTKDGKDQYKAYLYNIENPSKDVPVITKPGEGEKKLVISMNNDSIFTLSKVYIGYAKDQSLTDLEYLAQMNNVYDNFAAMSDNIKTYQGDALNNDGFELPKDGVYLVRIKYVDQEGNAQYEYDVIRVNGAFPKKNLLVSVDANTVTLTLEEYKIKSVKFYHCDLFGVETSQEPVLESTKAVNNLSKGLYVAHVVDEHNNNYTVQVNVKFEKVINESYITALRTAINNTKAYTGKVVLTDNIIGAVKYDGLNIELAQGKIGYARNADYENYLVSYLDAAETVLSSLNSLEDVYTQEDVNKATNNLNNALNTFKTKVVTDLVTVSGNSISCGLTVDGDSVNYMYVSKGVNLEYAQMEAADYFKKVSIKNNVLSVANLEDGVYTVRTKVTTAEGTSYNIYTYCYIGNSADMLAAVKEVLSNEITNTRNTKLLYALDSSEQLISSLRSNKAAIKLFSVYTSAKSLYGSSNSADDCLFATIDLMRTSSDTPSGLGGTNPAPQKDITFTLTDGSEHRYDYTANTRPSEGTVVLAEEDKDYANVHINATNIINYRIAYGEFTAADGYAAMESNGITTYTTAENTYKAKYNGIYTVRIKWADSTYTYQTFEVEGIPEPLTLTVNGSNIHARFNGGLGDVTLVQYLYGSSASRDNEYFTEFNADNGATFEDMNIAGLGNGVHTFKITVVKPDGTNMTYYEQARVTEQETLTLKQDATRIGFYANNVTGYQDVKYKELGDEIDFFHTSLNKMISQETFNKDDVYLIEIGSKNDEYVLRYLHNEFVLEPYVQGFNLDEE